MSELGTIIREARALRAAHEPFLLATVVRVRGSAYRRPGARMLLTATRWITGSISGGCLEGDIVNRGFWRTRETPAVVVTYDGTADDDMRSGFGLGCEGVVDVLVERLSSPTTCDPIDFAGRCHEEERAGVLATVFRSERQDVAVGARLAVRSEGSIATSIACGAVGEELARAARSMCARASGGTVTWASADGLVEALVETIVPPPHLFVFGSGHDAVPLVTIAKAIGWNVSACDRQGRFAIQERFALADRRLILAPPAIAGEVDARAHPLAVVMSHEYEHDREIVRALITSRARYIGILGPRKRTDRIFADLAKDGVRTKDGDLARIHAPIGLAIGAETPQEIALAIVAEAQSALTGTPAGRLRDASGGIHASAAQ